MLVLRLISQQSNFDHVKALLIQFNILRAHRMHKQLLAQYGQQVRSLSSRDHITEITRQLHVFIFWEARQPELPGEGTGGCLRVVLLKMNELKPRLLLNLRHQVPINIRIHFLKHFNEHTGKLHSRYLGAADQGMQHACLLRVEYLLEHKLPTSRLLLLAAALCRAALQQHIIDYSQNKEFVLREG